MEVLTVSPFLHSSDSVQNHWGRSSGNCVDTTFRSSLRSSSLASRVRSTHRHWKRWRSAKSSSTDLPDRIKSSPSIARICSQILIFRLSQSDTCISTPIALLGRPSPAETNMRAPRSTRASDIGSNLARRDGQARFGENPGNDFFSPIVVFGMQSTAPA